MELPENVIKKFWEHVEKTDTCWDWNGVLHHNYPSISLDGKEYAARKISLILNQIDIQDSTQVLFSCGNHHCVNPTHLFVRGSKSVEEKFYESIEKDKNGCWIWKGACSKAGLPIIRIGKAKEYSAKLISLRTRGAFPSKGELPSNSCLNKLCVNPQHLIIGDKERFLSKILRPYGDDGCWIWRDSWQNEGYGRLVVRENGKRKNYRAHVYSWMIFIGRAVPKGMLVCHCCDHPWCVNPDHLFIGTSKDNSEDMVSKGRQTCGEKCHDAKLTTDQVVEIRKLFASGVTRSQVAKLYNLSWSAVDKIYHGKTWKHLLT